tara:strand:+ start:302 stop:1066 length:765 start_codon:yes stop_codon:yes gene_type:complete
MEKNFIELNDVSVNYDINNLLAVSGLNMKIKSGSFSAVVGPSGCGKSTLMKILSGLITPTTGRVKINKKIVEGPQNFVGMAFQNPVMMPWRKTLENVLIPFEILKNKKSKEEQIHDATKLLKIVGLGDFIDSYPWQLSGGMQQRASLCRALVHKPKLLVLDEPFAALDAFTREELWCVLRDLWLDNKFTTLLVTHDLREASFLAEKIFVMSSRPGKITNIHDVDFEHKRDLKITYSENFIKLTKLLREQISNNR